MTGKELLPLTIADGELTESVTHVWVYDGAELTLQHSRVTGVVIDSFEKRLIVGGKLVNPYQCWINHHNAIRYVASLIEFHEKSNRERAARIELLRSQVGMFTEPDAIVRGGKS